MTAKTSRIIIKTFVRTALKDADESPERCTRNLVDMALHFSKGRFQQEFQMAEKLPSHFVELVQDALHEPGFLPRGDPALVLSGAQWQLYRHGQRSGQQSDRW